MGYILPIQQLTYNDYQRRIQPVKINPYYIRSLDPIEKTMNQQKYALNEKHFSQQQAKKTNQLPHDFKGRFISTYI